MSIFTQEEAKIAVEQLVPGLYFIQDFTFNSDLSIRTWPYNYPTPPPTKQEIQQKIEQLRINGTITHLATSVDPNSIALRCCLRYLMTALNDVREHVGMQRILESEHIQSLLVEAANGGGRKVDL